MLRSVKIANVPNEHPLVINEKLEHQLFVDDFPLKNCDFQYPFAM